MYKYVAKGEVAEYRAYCQDVMNRLKMKLEKECGIKAYVTLIGSGAHNMVTRDGEGSFDLDYNLVLTTIPQKYEKAPEQLKNLIRETLDNLINRKFSHGKGSTSSITYLAYSEDGKKVVFSFDVALIWERGSQYKLVHDKENNLFIWNQIRDSKDLERKISQIKNKKRWCDVRLRYLKMKNEYLSQQDKSHPSFVVYIEAVNQVYNSIKSGS